MALIAYYELLKGGQTPPEFMYTAVHAMHAVQNLQAEVFTTRAGSLIAEQLTTKSDVRGWDKGVCVGWCGRGQADLCLMVGHNHGTARKLEVRTGKQSPSSFQAQFDSGTAEDGDSWCAMKASTYS